jgi:hypothetical protein
MEWRREGMAAMDTIFVDELLGNAVTHGWHTAVLLSKTTLLPQPLCCRAMRHTRA